MVALDEDEHILFFQENLKANPAKDKAKVSERNNRISVIIRIWEKPRSKKTLLSEKTQSLKAVPAHSEEGEEIEPIKDSEKQSPDRTLIIFPLFLPNFLSTCSVVGKWGICMILYE